MMAPNVIILFFFLVYFIGNGENVVAEDVVIMAGARSGIYEYNTLTEDVTKIFDVPKSESIYQNYKKLVAVDNDYMIVERFNSSIGGLRLSSGLEENLYDNGRCPTYFESSDKLLFNRVFFKNGEYQEGLFSASLNGELEPVMVGKISRGTAAYCPIKLNSDTALVYLAYGRNVVIAMYDSSTGNLSKWDFRKSSRPILSLSSDRLLSLRDGKYELTDIRGKTLSEIDKSIVNPRSMYPLLYLERDDQILFGEYRENVGKQATVNVYLMDLKSQRLEKIIDNFYARPGGSVYIPGKSSVHKG